MKKEPDPIVTVIVENPKRRTFDEIEGYRPKFAELWLINKQYPRL